MQNKNNDVKNYSFVGVKSIQDYILLIRTNLKSLIIIPSIILIIFILYAVYTPNIYRSSVDLKITGQSKTVLKSESAPEASTFVNDRLIANEIEIIENYDTRERVAKALIDTFENAKDKNAFSFLRPKGNDTGVNGHKSFEEIAILLKTIVKVEQKAGMDVIEISVDLPSSFETALIANTYAEEYKKINLESNRYQFYSVRIFLEKQSQEKLAELNNAESELEKFKESGGIVSLDAQSAVLITQLSQLDAQRDAAKIDLMTSNGALEQYKKQISNQDPYIANYLESQTSQAYIDVLQKQIAELQMNRDMAMTNKSPGIDVAAKIKEYDRKINDLQEKLNSKIAEIKTGALSRSPNQVGDLTQKLIEEEIRNHSLSIKLNELQAIVNQYEVALNRIPKKSKDFAGYQRNMEALQQLYTLVQQKYQEAMINELSQPGNVIIVSKARVPSDPVKPNRMIIIIIGLFIGPIISLFYIIVKDYFDDTIKTPDDIEKNDISFLSWVPHSVYKLNKHQNHGELLVPYEADPSVSESFRTIKARIQYTRLDAVSPKIILVTSPAEGEGKSFVSFNLAGNFSQSEKKTLLIDGDIRRPKLHNILEVDKKPGLIDYLCHRVQLQDIIRVNSKNKLNYITAGSSGSTPINPAELFASKIMNNFLLQIRDYYDIIIIDSAPIVAVIDTEILARHVDGTILVISADKTKSQLMKDAINIIKRNNSPLIGTVLNNFKYKNGYGYYFKYYYNYSSGGKVSKKNKV